MLSHAQQKHIGAVGAKLFYPNSTSIQHVGISNPPEGPQHSFMTLDDQVPYYFGWNRTDNNCIGVTGACLLLKKEKFQEVGGFDEELAVAYNDVKLCFALHSKGYYNVIRNDAVAYHHESLSRGTDQQDDSKLIRLHKERMRLAAQFPDLKDRDPYMNDNLHHYTVGLDLKAYYDVLREIDISGCEPTGNAWVDFVNISDRVQILGWAALMGESKVEELDRYLILRDPFGKTYSAKTLPFSRQDLVSHFGSANYLYAGFECVLRKQDLRVDIMPYQMGVLTIGRDGRRYLAWCQESGVIRNPMPRPIPLPNKIISFGESKMDPSNVQWWMDECLRDESFYRIRGFAFVRGNDHYRYHKSLILRDRDGEAYEFEVQLEERVDVAYAFPNEHFLFYTGFVCYIYDSVLKPEREYEVYIRLRDQFEGNNIYNIATGQTVCT